MVGGSLWILQLLPPLKLLTMILLKGGLNAKKIKSNQINVYIYPGCDFLVIFFKIILLNLNLEILKRFEYNL